VTGIHILEISYCFVLNVLVNSLLLDLLSLTVNSWTEGCNLRQLFGVEETLLVCFVELFRIKTLPFGRGINGDSEHLVRISNSLVWHDCVKVILRL